MFHNPIDNRSLYNIVDYMKRSLQPYSEYFHTMSSQFNRISNAMDMPMNIPFVPDETKLTYLETMKNSTYHMRKIAGIYYLSHMLTRTYEKPEFNITDIKVGDDYCAVYELIVERKSFCNLLHFKKLHPDAKKMPKMLVVAPMSGHHATLLRNTVTDLLPYYDVYITDWKDARNVPLIDGSFDLDEFAQYIVSFIQKLGPDIHVMAVCQSTVPVLIAVALMATENDQASPLTLTLLGGPIDTSQSPTMVNELATTRGDDWFKSNVISIVPSHYPGAMRLVFPGFMQLSGFLSMNIQRHMESLGKAIEDYAENKVLAALKTLQFYQEFFSTMDLTAEFYIQTINSVFQQKLLTKGRYKSRGKQVRLQDIKTTAIFAIEGGRDDITGVGQTKSVLGFCKNLPEKMKRYLLAPEVGHYGLFNGSAFRNIISPAIQAFTRAHTPKQSVNLITKKVTKKTKKKT